MSDPEASPAPVRGNVPLPRWAIPACRLWHRPSPQGFSLAGVWGGLKIMVFVNPDRRDARDAEYVLCVAAPLPSTPTDATPVD